MDQKHQTKQNFASFTSSTPVAHSWTLAFTSTESIASEKATEDESKKIITFSGSHISPIHASLKPSIETKLKSNFDDSSVSNNPVRRGDSSNEIIQNSNHPSYCDQSPTDLSYTSVPTDKCRRSVNIIENEKEQHGSQCYDQNATGTDRDEVFQNHGRFLKQDNQPPPNSEEVVQGLHYETSQESFYGKSRSIREEFDSCFSRYTTANEMKTWIQDTPSSCTGESTLDHAKDSSDSLHSVGDILTECENTLDISDKILLFCSSDSSLVKSRRSGQSVMLSSSRVTNPSGSDSASDFKSLDTSSLKSALSNEYMTSVEEKSESLDGSKIYEELSNILSHESPVRRNEDCGGVSDNSCQDRKTQNSFSPTKNDICNKFTYNSIDEKTSFNIACKDLLGFEKGSEYTENNTATIVQHPDTVNKTETDIDLEVVSHTNERSDLSNKTAFQDSLHSYGVNISDSLAPVTANLTKNNLSLNTEIKEFSENFKTEYIAKISDTNSATAKKEVMDFGGGERCEMSVSSFESSNSHLPKTFGTIHGENKIEIEQNIIVDDEHSLFTQAIPEKSHFEFSNPITFENVLISENRPILESTKKHRLALDEKVEKKNSEISSHESLQIDRLIPLISLKHQLINNTDSPAMDTSFFSNVSKEVLADVESKCKPFMDPNVNDDVINITNDNDKVVDYEMESISYCSKLNLSSENSPMDTSENDPASLDNNISASLKSLFGYHPLQELYDVNKSVAKAVTEAILKTGDRRGATVPEILKFISQHKLVQVHSKVDQDVRRFLKAAHQLNIVKVVNHRYIMSDRIKSTTPQQSKRQEQKDHSFRNKEKKEKIVCRNKKMREQKSGAKSLPIFSNAKAKDEAPRTPKGMVSRRLRSRTLLIKRNM